MFAFYDGIPVTPPLKRPPAQTSDFKPRCIGDLLYPWAIERIDWWMRNYHEELERFAHFEWPTWCVEQAAAAAVTLELLCAADRLHLQRKYFCGACPGG